MLDAKKRALFNIFHNFWRIEKHGGVGSLLELSNAVLVHSVKRE